MNELEITLSTMKERTRPFHARVPEDALKPEGVESLGIDTITIDGTLSALEPEYMFAGTVSGAFHHPCDRCLEPAVLPFQVDLTLVFEPGEPPADVEELDEHEVTSDDVEGDTPHYFQNERIDLRDAVWEEVALAAPTKFLCREDCKGLCPKCGANLNNGPCGCKAVEAKLGGNLGFAGLADLFPDLPDQSDRKS